MKNAVGWRRTTRYRKSLAPKGFLTSVQCILSCCYEDGSGAAKDHAEAVRWYRKVAVHENSLLQLNLQMLWIMIAL